MQSRPRAKSIERPPSPLFVSFDFVMNAESDERHLQEFHGTWRSNDSSTDRWQPLTATVAPHTLVLVCVNQFVCYIRSNRAHLCIRCRKYLFEFYFHPRPDEIISKHTLFIDEFCIKCGFDLVVCTENLCCSVRFSCLPVFHSIWCRCNWWILWSTAQGWITTNMKKKKYFHFSNGDCVNAIRSNFGINSVLFFCFIFGWPFRWQEVETVECSTKIGW